jgi:hypothetical protein
MGASEGGEVASGSGPTAAQEPFYLVASDWIREVHSRGTFTSSRSKFKSCPTLLLCLSALTSHVPTPCPHACSVQDQAWTSSGQVQNRGGWAALGQDSASPCLTAILPPGLSGFERGQLPLNSSSLHLCVGAIFLVFFVLVAIFAENFPVPSLW